jgi:hypothetical protein
MGVWAILQGNSGLSPQLSIIGGVLTEFIGAGFFYLYSKNFRTFAWSSINPIF